MSTQLLSASSTPLKIDSGTPVPKTFFTSSPTTSTPSSPSLPLPIPCSTNARDITIQTGRQRGGRIISLDFLLMEPSIKPIGVVVMFPGGDGLNMFSECSSSKVTLSNIFVVRIAPYFVERGFAVVILNVPSDYSNIGVGDSYRVSRDELEDIDALKAFLGEKSLGPIYFIGTSRGTLSEAYLATQYTHGEIDKIVLTSTIATDSPYFTNEPQNGGLELQNINIPVLMIHNSDDGCSLAPYIPASLLIKRFVGSPDAEFIPVSGGAPISAQDPDPCQALAYHGFFGMDRSVAELISNWLLK